MKVGQVTHGFEVLEFWDYKHFINVCNNLNKVSKRKGWWIRLINANKLICPITDLKVKYVSLDINRGRPNKKKKTQATFHYNFYSECGKLFTVDHIIPRSKGGAENDVNNLQPMIAKYNWEKGDDVNYRVIQQAPTEVENDFKGNTITKPIKPNEVSLFQKFSGADLYVKKVIFGELPIELIPTSQRDTPANEMVDVKVHASWKYDLTNGFLNVIPKGAKEFTPLYDPSVIKNLTNQIKKGGTSSENILKNFLSNIMTLHDGRKEE